MSNRTQVGGLDVDSELLRFVNEQALPGTGIKASKFWSSLENIITELSPENRQLLEVREKFQRRLDKWYRAHRGNDFDFKSYKRFLKDIEYLVKEGGPFQVETFNVDPEITDIAGPQLVVPATNARYALNAVNARWGSLYDSLYGTDVIPENDGAENTEKFNPVRGKRVIEWARDFLNESVPLYDRSWRDVHALSVTDRKLLAAFADGSTTGLSDPDHFVGYTGLPEFPDSILLRKHGLHIAIVIDRNHPIGKSDPAGISTIELEAAISTIVDCEDSVAVVDGEDKVLAYRNWLGLMKGDLEDTFIKDDRKITRRMNNNREYNSPTGNSMVVRGTALLLVRNVGHLMTNPAIQYDNGKEVPEGILDCMITSLIALHDVGKNGRYVNSPAGSVYIVKPKMHGPDEVAFACKLFSRVEAALGMEENTLKMGIMDEERRTTVNLKECIRQAKNRVVFINTGFLDRTGDEIHTSMQSGPMLRKADMKDAAWIQAYEDWNVDIGLECGLSGKAQIGKGMWAMPDLMADMLEQKIAHPKAGANTAWVPSPTAAILHATHYHKVNVKSEQAKIAHRDFAKLDDILSVPVATQPNWSAEDIQREIDNNAQGILGYVVRWVDQGVGCSKVPDINEVGLMEDRATLRISSQHIANWLCHNVCSKEQVMESLKRMATIVDRQNAGDPTYKSMAEDFEKSIAFQAACDLVFDGEKSPSGYTEPTLHKKRLEVKLKKIG